MIPAAIQCAKQLIAEGIQGDRLMALVDDGLSIGALEYGQGACLGTCAYIFADGRLPGMKFSVARRSGWVWG